MFSLGHLSTDSLVLLCRTTDELTDISYELNTLYNNLYMRTIRHMYCFTQQCTHRASMHFFMLCSTLSHSFRTLLHCRYSCASTCLLLFVPLFTHYPHPVLHIVRALSFYHYVVFWLSCVLLDSSAWCIFIILVCDAKHKRRQLERRWRSTKLDVHHQLYRDYCVVINRLLCSTKIAYYETQIVQCPHTSKAMFRTVNMLMGNKGGCPLPSHTSDLQLASDFSNLFTSKVSTIPESLNHLDTSNFVSPLDDDAPATLHSFSPTTIEEIVRIIKLSPNKSCELDPLPTWLLKLCAQELAPIITAIVNRSFEASCMPTKLKRAHVRPRLKKSSLDPDVLNNYRPVSNLPFVSKIIEKVVDARLEEHLRENDLHEPLQSAYRKHHSTERALIKIQSDILQALDSGWVAALVLLDLSAAFDTIDHSILIERLQKSFGISGDALTWVVSYL